MMRNIIGFVKPSCGIVFRLGDSVAKVLLIWTWPLIPTAE